MHAAKVAVTFLLRRRRCRMCEKLLLRRCRMSEDLLLVLGVMVMLRVHVMVMVRVHLMQRLHGFQLGLHLG